MPRTWPSMRERRVNIFECSVAMLVYSMGV
jgi:hypothetical protein